MLQYTGQPLQQRINWSKISTVLRLKNPALWVSDFEPRLQSLGGLRSSRQDSQTPLSFQGSRLPGTVTELLRIGVMAGSTPNLAPGGQSVPHYSMNSSRT